MKYLCYALAFLIALFPLQVLAETAQVTLVSPPQGEDLTGKDVEIAVSYNTGSTDKATYVELLIDSKKYAGKYLQTPQSRGICSFLWNTIDYTNGSHSIIVKIFSGDKLIGSVSGGAHLGNKPIDVIPPKINFYKVQSGETVSGVRDIKMQAVDNSGVPPIVSVSVDKQLKLIKNSPPYSYEWDTTAYDDGKHVVTAWGYDEAGNRGDAGSVELIVKNASKVTTASAKPLIKEEKSAVAVAPVKASATLPEKVIQPAVPSINSSSRSSAARSAETIAKLPEVKPGLTAPVVSSKPSASVKAAPAISRPAPPAAKPQASRNSESATDREITEMALAVPSSLASIPVSSDSSARVSLPGISRKQSAPVSTIKAIEGLEETQVSAKAAEPSGGSFTEVMAKAPSLDFPAGVDPLEIPAGTTSPELKLSEPVMMAMRSSAASFECPLVECSPTRPALPVVTPHVAPIRSASADVKGLINGIEAGMSMSAPGGIQMAKLPESMSQSANTSKAQAKSSKVVRGKVKLIMDDSKVGLTPASEKSGIPAAALRKVLEQIGGLVVWDADSKTITAYNHGVRVTMRVGEPKAKVNGKSIKLAAPVTIEDNRALVDLKFLKTALRMELEYNPETGEFTLRSK